MIRLETKNYNTTIIEKKQKITIVNVSLMKKYYLLILFKTNSRSRKKQVEALHFLNPKQQLKSIEGIFPWNFLNIETKEEIDTIEMDRTINH